MYHLKLIKGLSYTGKVKATANRPHAYVDDKADADYLVSTGYFKLVEDNTLTVEEAVGEPLPEITEDNINDEKVCDPQSTEDNGFKPLDEMNISELETFATYKGISLKGIRKKDDIIKKLREELPEKELEGIIVYGSPTMVELEDN